MTTERLLIVDTDAGIDDAVALFAALRAHADPDIPLTILGVTTVAGNTDLLNVCSNVATVLKTAGQSKIPVFRGASKPLVQPTPQMEFFYYGKDGFGDANIERGVAKLMEEPAELALIRLAHQYAGKLTIACLGPLTNIARAIKLDPTFVASVKEFWLMGGNLRENDETPSFPEFNFWFDPDATCIVLKAASSAKQMHIIPFETCTKDGSFDLEFRTQTLGKLDTPQVKLLNQIEQNHLEKIRKGEEKGWVPCDALITAVFIDPKVVRESVQYACSIDLGKHCPNRGVIKLIHPEEPGMLNVLVVTRADKERFGQVLLWGCGGNCTIT